MSSADDKLAMLCNELAEHRHALGDSCSSQFSHQQPLVAAHTAMLPLVHGMNDAEGLPALHAILGQSALRSAADRDANGSPKDLERWLGLHDCVYTAAGVLYPQKNVALLFRATVEESSSAQASPWDSGAFGRRYGLKHAADDERARCRELFHRYCLPAPLYRKYLCSYISTCYGNIYQYLHGHRNSFPDPLNIVNQDSFSSRIFEVRFPQQLPVSSMTLLALFVRDKAGNEKWVNIKRYMDALAAQGVYVDYYPYNANLHKRVQDFIDIVLKRNS